jgi:hypothetical protein
MKQNPVLVTMLVPIIVWVATYFGLDMNETVATAIAGLLLVILGSVTHLRKVTPVANPHDNQGRPLVPVESSAPKRG